MSVADLFISKAYLVAKLQMSANPLCFCGHESLVMKQEVAPLIFQHSYWTHAKVLEACLQVFLNACLLSWTRLSITFARQAQDWQHRSHSGIAQESGGLPCLRVSNEVRANQNLRGKSSKFCWSFEWNIKLWMRSLKPVLLMIALRLSIREFLISHEPAL